MERLPLEVSQERLTQRFKVERIVRIDLVHAQYCGGATRSGTSIGRIGVQFPRIEVAPDTSEPPLRRQFVLPDRDRSNPSPVQSAPVTLIPPLISKDLRHPECPIALRKAATAGAPVPEAAVNEYRERPTFEVEVRRARQICPVTPPARDPESAESPRDFLLSRSVSTPPHLCHEGGSLVLREGISSPHLGSWIELPDSAGTEESKLRRWCRVPLNHS